MGAVKFEIEVMIQKVSTGNFSAEPSLSKEAKKSAITLHHRLRLQQPTQRCYVMTVLQFSGSPSFARLFLSLPAIAQRRYLILLAPHYFRLVDLIMINRVEDHKILYCCVYLYVVWNEPGSPVGSFTTSSLSRPIIIVVTVLIVILDTQCWSVFQLE